MSDVQTEADNLLAAIKTVIKTENPTPLHEPSIGEKEQSYVANCVASGWVSSVGEYVTKFEEDLAAYTGSKYAIAMVNGTAALHLSYVLAGISKGDEVLCPSLTFVATANAIKYTGATPHFVDIDPVRLTVCPKLLSDHLKEISTNQNGQTINKQTNRPIKSLVVMHSYGHPADMNALKAVCNEYNISLIEDAAESLGSYYNGQHTGMIGDVAALSFNGNKIITTGGGGAIITNDDALAKRAKHLSTTAKLAHAYEYQHDELGYNYRMPNINAAMGVAQLERLPGFLEKKRILATSYIEVFAGLDNCQIVREPDGTKSNYWLNLLLVKNADVKNSLLESCHQNKIYTRPAWLPMHQLPMFAGCPKSTMTHTDDIYNRLVCLPSSSVLAGN